MWEVNYKAMDAPQLVAELEKLAKRPHLYDNHIERKACIATELALKIRPPQMPTPMLPIILLEDDDK